MQNAKLHVITGNVMESVNSMFSGFIVKSNELIRSCWLINSVWEMRIVNLIASKISPSDEDFKTYMISFSEIMGQYKGGGTLKIIYEVLSKMMYYGLKSTRKGVVKILKKGLAGSDIKIIGTILMVFDHIHQMFLTNGAPEWLNWLGRPVLPIFLFMCAEGFYHTHGQKRYLLRLFIGFVFMSAMNMALSLAMPNDDVALMNNVFGTMLLTALYLFFIEELRKGFRERRAGKIAAGLLLILLPIAYAILFVIFMDALPRYAFIALAFIPNLMATEGGFTAVILGVLFYLFRKRRFLQTLSFSAFCLLSFITGFASGSAQWMMVFALIPILLYNGARGKGSKYFFYVFYPAHIYLLYIIAWFIKR